MYKVTIPMRLPGLNDIIDANRTNRFKGAKLKRDTQDAISWYLKKLPKFEKPIKIHFKWTEANHRRDIDNIAAGKKFILDAMQELGKIPNDNSKYIKGFTDTFEYSDKYSVELEIEEMKTFELEVQDD